MKTEQLRKLLNINIDYESITKLLDIDEEIIDYILNEKNKYIIKDLVRVGCNKYILENKYIEEQLKIMEKTRKEKTSNASQLLEYEYISTTEQLNQYLEILEKQNIKHFDSTKEVKDGNKVYKIKK